MYVYIERDSLIRLDTYKKNKEKRQNKRTWITVLRNLLEVLRTRIVAHTC